MSYFRHGDPLDDFDELERERERQELLLPMCDNPKCRKRIHDDIYFEIDGEILCEDCMIDRYGRQTEDYEP
jgi:hypothetical protein